MMIRKKITQIMMAFIATGLLMLPTLGFAQFTSIGGEWFVTILGKEKGKALLEIDVPSSGLSTVRGQGFIKGMEQSFFVKELEQAQQIRIEYNGNIIGAFEI